MKTVFIYIASVCLMSTNIQAQIQKKDLDTTTFNKWAYVGSPAISNNGEYAGFTTQYGSAHNYSAPKTLSLKSTQGNWSRDFGPGITKFAFTGDSRRVFILERNNTLKVIQLGANDVIKTYKAISFHVFEHDKEEWVLIGAPDQTVLLVNTKTLKETAYPKVKQFYQDEYCNRLFLTSTDDKLSFIDMKSLKETAIGEFKNLSGLTLDQKGNTVAFIMDKAVWIWNVKGEKPTRLVGDDLPDIDSNLYISGVNRFSRNNERLFITLSEKKAKPEIEPGAVNVRVWNYKDSRLRTDPGKNFSAQSFLCAIDLKTKQFNRIQQKFEEVRFLSDAHTDLIAIEYVKGAEYEKHWNPLAQPQFFIYDCRYGSKNPLRIDPRSLSPDGRYVIGVDSLEVDFVAWDSQTHQHHDITHHLLRIPDQKGVAKDDLKYWGFEGWYGQHHLLLRDEYDIWMVDVSDTTAAHATNLTNGLGKKENLVFKFPNARYGRLFTKNELSLVIAFNKVNKQKGFYRLSPGRNTDPKRLNMSDNFYGDYFIKAKQSNIGIIQKERADSSTNYFLTSDFRFFKPLSNVYPEQSYKWLTSELIKFNTLDGTPSQAIVYKPADFDPGKKYPLIVNYYERFSDDLNRYVAPEATMDDPNVPFFVANGYIVVKPDIPYIKTHALECALNSVEGVARHLVKLNYVDSTNVGIIGHSWGAIETNYMISHSNYFKAAISNAGIINLTSAATSLTLNGSNYYDTHTSTRQGRLGYSMWERPELYIRDSPILDVNKITTPVLIVANEKDAVVNVEQGLQFFWALRRLHKPAWLLQYSGEGHSVLLTENRIDYSNKILSFLIII